MIEKCRDNSYNERLKILELTTLENRKYRADLLGVSKILKGFNEEFIQGAAYENNRALNEIV